MEHPEEFFNRKSIRLKKYDYTSPGAYFITICTHHSKCLFGDITNSEIVLNKYGLIAEDELMKTKILRKNIEIDCHIIMPNHIHGIIIIKDLLDKKKTTSNTLRTGIFAQPVPNSVSSIIGCYKAAVTRKINKIRCENLPLWQLNYYEHVIRNLEDLKIIQEYIINNPRKWNEDRYFINNIRLK